MRPITPEAASLFSAATCAMLCELLKELADIGCSGVDTPVDRPESILGTRFPGEARSSVGI